MIQLAMGHDMNVKQLPSGWWHIRLDGHRGWAQPPTWPCADIEQYIHDDSTAFRHTVCAENDQLLIQFNTVKQFNDLTLTHNGCVQAKAMDIKTTATCQNDWDHGPATIFTVIGDNQFELCAHCGVPLVTMLAQYTVKDGGVIDVKVYR